MSYPYTKLPVFKPQDLQRFWSKVNKDPGQGPQGECWTWQANHSKGYGTFRVNDKIVKAHRVAYYLFHGTDPAPLDVLHRCDNPPCVRPEHLFRGTNADNVADRQAKGRKIHTEPWQVGGQNNYAKLNDAKVLAIRSSSASSREIALLYGISIGHVCGLRQKNSKYWKHLIPAS